MAISTVSSQNEKFAIKLANQRIADNLKAALGLNLSQGTMIQFSEVSFCRIVEGLRLLYFPNLTEADTTQFRSLEENSLGYNNLLYIASILAELILEEDEDRGEETYLRLLLIEEPEAHLHPQLQLRLLRHLKTVAEDRGIQVIITTHSTVISAAVSWITLSIFPMMEGLPRYPETVRAPLQSRRFVDRWLDVTKSNLLFSKGALLVEGIAEAIVLPELARIVLCPYGEGKNCLDDYGVSVINLGGIYFNYFMQLFCDVTGAQPGENVPIRCAGLTDNDPPKSVETVTGQDGKEKAVPFLPHDGDCPVGDNPALELQGPIGQSQYSRLFAGKYKTFEYDIAMEGNNLRCMSTTAASLWPVPDGDVVKGLKAAAKLDFAAMKSDELAHYAGDMLDRIEKKRSARDCMPRHLQIRWLTLRKILWCQSTFGWPSSGPAG